MLRTWASTVLALRHSSVDNALFESPWAMRASTRRSLVVSARRGSPSRSLFTRRATSSGATLAFSVGNYVSGDLGNCVSGDTAKDPIWAKRTRLLRAEENLSGPPIAEGQVPRQVRRANKTPKAGTSSNADGHRSVRRLRFDVRQRAQG